MAAIYSNGGNRWNILGFNFTKLREMRYLVYIIYLWLRGGGHWDLRYGGISLIFLRFFGIFLEKLRYYDIENLAVHGICNFGPKNCGYWRNFLAVLRYWIPPNAPLLRGRRVKTDHSNFLRLQKSFILSVWKKSFIKWTKNVDFGIVVSLKFFFAIIFGCVRKQVKTLITQVIFELFYISQFISRFYG
jgi:hypothetical protein